MASTKCWACGVIANMSPIPGSGTRHDFYEPRAGAYLFCRYMACFRCDGCSALNLVSVSIDTDSAPRDDIDIVAWLAQSSLAHTGGLYTYRWLPDSAHGKKFPDVPKEIAEPASEAHVCRSTGAPRAAVLMARAVIEAAAKNQGLTTGSLLAKIDAMYERRLIREDVRDGAHEVRHLGNDMAHGDFAEPVREEDVDLILTLMNEVLEEVFQSPARVRRRRQSRLAERSRLPATSGPTGNGDEPRQGSPEMSGP